MNPVRRLSLGNRASGVILAHWTDAILDYRSLYFFPTLRAVNVQWHEMADRRVDS